VEVLTKGNVKSGPSSRFNAGV